MELLLRYDDPRVVDDPHHLRFATVTPGAPGRCPGCDAFGYIDHTDPRRGLQTQHCRACGTTWEFRFRADGSILEVWGRIRSAAAADVELPEETMVVDIRTRDGVDPALEPAAQTTR